MFRTRTGIAIASGMAIFAVLAFTLSFVSLNALAQRMGHPNTLSWIYPILIDGLAIFSTLGIFWRHDYDVNARYEWFLLVVTSILSLLGNVANALPTNQDITQPVKLILAGIPPILLVFIVHTVVRNFKFALQSARRFDEPELVASEAPSIQLPMQMVEHSFNDTIVRRDSESELKLPPLSTNTVEKQLPKKADSRPTDSKPVLRAVKEPVGNKNTVDIQELADWIVQSEESGNRIIGSDVQAHLGVSLATAKRRLREARKLIEMNNRKEII